jgi:hypothetical protein
LKLMSPHATTTTKSPSWCDHDIKVSSQVLWGNPETRGIVWTSEPFRVGPITTGTDNEPQTATPCPCTATLSVTIHLNHSWMTQKPARPRPGLCWILLQTSGEPI